MGETMVPPDSQKSKIPYPELSPPPRSTTLSWSLRPSSSRFRVSLTRVYRRHPATFLGKQRAHRRTPQPSRCGSAAPRAAAVGALASIHEARDPVRHPRESGTALAAVRRGLVRWRVGD
ncbi:hypothetical protein FB107DRAFT_225335 [Schizophyllum commune]